MKNTFQFEIYRLNIVDEQTLFAGTTHALIRSDEQIVRLLNECVHSKYDIVKEGRSAVYKWGLRSFSEFEPSPEYGNVVSIRFARAMLQKQGTVLTEDGLENAISEPDLPLADTITVFFFLTRHIVAVEFSSVIMQTNIWRNNFSEVSSKAAFALQYGSHLEIEPIPFHNEIIQLFKSFQKIMRIRVHLRFPNPELSRFTQKLYDDLQQGGIREYIQDMRNPAGLSKNEEALPFSSASLAQAGYKKGEITIEGVKDGKVHRVRTGGNAARGKIDVLRDYVRGIAENTRSKEATQVAQSIYAEIQRLAPQEDGKA